MFILHNSYEFYDSAKTLFRVSFCVAAQELVNGMTYDMCDIIDNLNANYQNVSLIDRLTEYQVSHFTYEALLEMLFEDISGWLKAQNSKGKLTEISLSNDNFSLTFVPE